ncbi:MAG: DUF3795 domain-containing protein [Lentisphaerota bacterium]
MNVLKKLRPRPIQSAMIAPCGMNCALCMGHLRERNRCMGCNGDDAHNPPHCVVCRIKHCEEIKGKAPSYCFTCDKFPCQRLRHLDKRYRLKYGMSMVENLETIQAIGIRRFILREKARWKCPKCGGVICVHRELCMYCGYAWDHGQVAPLKVFPKRQRMRSGIV